MGRRKYAHSKNLAKKARYHAIELARLKKILGIMDIDQNNEVTQNAKAISNLQVEKDLQENEKISTEDKELKYELEENKEKGVQIEVKNEKTGKVHVYNTKTLKDQHGNYPPWFKRGKIPKRLRKKAYSQKKKFNQQWTTTHVQL